MGFCTPHGGPGFLMHRRDSIALPRLESDMIRSAFQGLPGMIWGWTRGRPEQAHRAPWEATAGKQMKGREAQAGKVAEE